MSGTPHPEGRTRIAIDVSPLRHSRDYRLLWFGQLVSMCGTQLRFVAVPYQVYLMTRSPLAVGLIGLFQAGPLVAFSMWGGVIADAVDRRKLLLMTQAGLVATSAGFAVVTQAGAARVWLLYVLTAVASTFSAVDGPARQSMIPTLVRRSEIPQAMALNQVLFQAAGVTGPALGGLALARFGLAAAYWIDVGTFGAALAGLVAMRAPPRTPGGARPGWASLMEGLRYLGGNRILLSIMALDFVAMFFGWPRAMFPFYADQVFRVGPQGLGFLFAAPGAGALVGALTAGWVSSIRRAGAATLVCVTIWGLAIAGFGVVRVFPAALVLLAVAGAADVYSAIFRGTILQLEVPDHLRGRMTAVNLMVVISGPQLGHVESGLVAALTSSPQLAVVSGGLACLAGVVGVALRVPALVRHRVDHLEG